MVRDSKSKDTRKKGGLGRGIEALFEDEPQVEETEEVQELELSDIRPNPYQPGKHFDDKSLKELSDSIKENGVFQPIIVMKLLQVNVDIALLN